MRRFTASAVWKAVAGLALVGLTQSAWAGFVAPSYAGQVNSTSSVWNYNGDWYTGSGASHLGSFTHVDGPYLLDQSSYGPECTPGQPCLRDRSLGSPLDFYIPNYVDELPYKFLRIQYQFVRSPSPNFPDPQVMVIGFDPTVGSVMGQLLNAQVQTDTFMTGGVFLSYMVQDWRIQPNPDFERITVTGASGAELRQLRIDTISISEPVSLALALGALGAAGLARRRR